MCADCPVFSQRLHGEAPLEKRAEEAAEGVVGLYCVNCRTTMESIKMGNPLGCSECYEVFADVLLSELIATDHIPSSLKKALKGRRSQSIHIGKTPDQSLQMESSTRLTALNEALNDALKKENYEQAAWLRDQIKALHERKE
jgi:protein arginine kinase activator